MAIEVRDMTDAETLRALAIRNAIYVTVIDPLLDENPALFADVLNVITGIEAEMIFRVARDKGQIAELSQLAQKRIELVATAMYDKWVADGALFAGETSADQTVKH